MEKELSKTQEFKEKEQEFIKIAKENGLEDNIFFKNTFETYQFQLQILNNLEKSIKEIGETVTKEYVKGRGNIYINPAIKEYNNTVNSINKTVSTLIKIIKDNKGGKDKETEDPLANL